jgi:hypothetical protein
MSAPRFTEAQFAALMGQKKRNAGGRKVVITNGYRSNVQGERTIGGKTYYFRSLWEINFARTLEFWKSQGILEDWWYECHTFRFPKDAYEAGPFSYLPDFKVKHPNGFIEWYEVKGYMNTMSKQKLKRLAKHFPDVKITVIDKAWFNKEGYQLKKIVRGWETLSSQVSQSTGKSPQSSPEEI